MTIGTGQGKTAMIWMIAIALQNETGASRILIVTPNDAIKQQFSGYFPLGIVPNGIEVTDEPNFQQFHEFDVALIDEGDLIVHDWCVNIQYVAKSPVLRGLHSLRGKPFIMFSATFQDGDEAIMRLAMDCNDSKHWLRLQPWQEAVLGNKQKTHFEWHPFSKAKQAYGKLTSLVKELYKEQPVLVFYEEKTKELTDALDAAYKPAKSSLAIIDDSKSLQQAQLVSAEIENGVFLLG